MKPAVPNLADTLAVFKNWLWLEDTGHVEIALGTVAANYCTGDPVWTVIVGPPSSGKTEPLNSIAGLKDVHPAAVLTEGALLSGTPQKELESGTRGGLLRAIGGFGILLVKDFGSVISLNKDTRGQVLAGLREIYDGSWTRHVGTGGGRTLHWSGKCGFLGGATAAIDSAYAVMGALGERFLFYRLGEGGEQERGRLALAHVGREPKMRAELATAVQSLFDKFTPPNHPPKLSPSEQERLNSLATFTTRCRSAVERDAYSASREIINVLGVESPSRVVKQLAMLMGGLEAVGVTRRRSWELITKMGLDSMPSIRSLVVQALVSERTATTSRIAELTRYPTNTVRRTLQDLACYSIVTGESQSKGNPDLWTVTDWTDTTYRAATSPTNRDGT